MNQWDKVQEIAIASQPELGLPYAGEHGIVYKAKLSRGFGQPFSQAVAVKTLKGEYIAT